MSNLTEPQAPVSHTPGPWWRSVLHPDWIMGYRDGMESVIAMEVFNYADAELIASAPKLKAQRDALLEAAKEAVATIRSFHGIGLGDSEEAMWELYQTSPEMKQINAAIAMAEEEL